MKFKLFLKTLIVFMLSAQAFISAQDSKNALFEYTSRGEISFSQEQSQKVDRMINNPIYLSHHFVKVNNLIDVQNNGEIMVNLPDKVNPEKFVTKRSKYTSPTDYEFYGDLGPCDIQRMGYVHIIAKDGNVYGQINLEDEIYDLQDLGNNRNVLFKIDQSIYTESECVTDHTPKVKSSSNKLNSTTRSGGGCDVRVLVLFTDAANQIGNPFNSANLFIEQTNQSICNSEADVTFTLAGVRELVGFNESNGGANGLVDITATRDALQTNDNANQLRNQFEADMVVLLTDGDFFFVGSQIFGVSFLMNWGDPSFAYAVVEIDGAGGRFTFSHELAHDFGCKHNNDNRTAPAFVFDAQGHNFSQGCCWPFRPTRGTVMNRLDDGSRIMHFSNPDVKFKGKKTGVVDSRDNEDQITAEGCNISAYKTFTPPMNVTISGLTYGTPADGPYTWCVDVTSCDDVENIVWEYSVNGFDFYQVLNVNNLCWTGNIPQQNNLTFRVTVTCSDGETDTAWFWVRNDDKVLCDPKVIGEDTPSTRRNGEGKVQEISVFPNPTADIINIGFNSEDTKSRMITIRNIEGLIVSKFTLDQVILGNNKAKYDISNLTGGYYMLNINGGQDLKTKSFIKL
ncbi:MAG: hypothetical protein ACJATI_005525 [Halioglobus sp.]|jgi:hypothetical protein